MADTIDYFLQFPDKASAEYDLIVGPLITGGGTGGTNEVLVYQGDVNSVDALPGYCIQVPQSGDNPDLESHPNIVLVNNATLYRQGLPSVGFSVLLPVEGLIIIVNAFGPYAIQSLRPGPPSPGPPSPARSIYITETGVPYITEDGLNFYVLEYP